MRNMIVSMSFVFLALVSTIVFAEDKAIVADTSGKGFYLSGNAGANWLSDGDYGEDEMSTEADYDRGLLLGTAFGYDFGKVRTEFEFAYRKNDFDKFKDMSALGYNLDDTSLSGDVTTLSYLLNGYIDFENKSSLTPYIGGGFGFADIELDDVRGTVAYKGLDVASVHINDDDIVFAYQAAVGVGYDINKSLTLDAGYRYFATEDPEFDSVDAEYDSHNFSVTVRYKFW